MNSRATDVDSYLAGLPDEMRVPLEAIRRTIKASAPNAVESISYGMPTYKYQDRPLIYFGASKNHCAIYGVDEEAHKDALAAYDTSSKGTVRFPPGEPLPEALVEDILRTRIAQIEAATAARKPA
jgi:uncharacterized protein YdhG (YjbR/CyaY superfamily)